jgi:hypothetical protein
MVDTAITVRFDPKNIYKGNRTMRNDIIPKVQSAAPQDAASATVVQVEFPARCSNLFSDKTYDTMIVVDGIRVGVTPETT